MLWISDHGGIVLLVDGQAPYFEATLGSMIADDSKLILSADMSDSRLTLFELNLVLFVSMETSSSIDSTLSHENWSIDGHFEPRRMYLLRLSVDCKNESLCIPLVFTCFAGKLNLHALLNETALFGIPFAALLFIFGADDTLITVIV
jgi:hypothetical protein